MRKWVTVYFILAISLLCGLIPNTHGELVAYYPFNGNANDESGNGNHGTVYGATLTADQFGNPNSAYSFDGMDDYISASSDILNDYPVGTVSALIYLDSTPTYSAPIVSKGTFLATDFYFAINQDLKLVAHMGTSLYLESNTLINLETWTKVALTWDGSEWCIYINDSELPDAQAQTDNAPLYSLNSTKIGRHEHSQGPFYFDGYIDEVTFHDLIIPEPATLLLLSLGGILIKRKRNNIG